MCHQLGKPHKIDLQPHLKHASVASVMEPAKDNLQHSLKIQLNFDEAHSQPDSVADQYEYPYNIRVKDLPRVCHACTCA